MGDRLAYSLTETAEALGVSRPTVYELVKRPGFPVFQIGGRRLVSVEGLRDWVRREAGCGRGEGDGREAQI